MRERPQEEFGRLGPWQGHASENCPFESLAAERCAIRQARERGANLICIILAAATATMALPLIARGLASGIG